ncbi:phage minor tail protein G [Serratia marcescens]|uniref:phage tail assembly chaperone G n=1 Tax=Serratia marcescens TaxID=615 RepID=UPI0018826337|nr:phage minor tail protein G [Serratia marcescens]QOV53550.1 phage minor tail protein G [Serratia marcescens]
MLKKDTFEYADQKIDISELSGLQRIDYLAFIKKEADQFDAMPDDTRDSDKNIAFTTMRLRINAWLIARSIWNIDKKQDVENLHQNILVDWSGAAIASCSHKILTLSDMIPTEIEPAADATVVDEPDHAPAITPEKP